MLLFRFHSKRHCGSSTGPFVPTVSHLIFCRSMQFTAIPIDVSIYHCIIPYMQIEISEPLFRRLQNNSVPLVDTVERVIERALDSLESHRSSLKKLSPSADIPAVPQSGIRQLDPLHPPSFLHATVRGDFGGAAFANWNELMRIAHVGAFKKAGSFEALRTATRAQLASGARSDSGYKYIPEIKISLQGVDADRAWQHSLRLAMYLQKPLKAWVTWRPKEAAAFPGETAFISWTPQ